MRYSIGSKEREVKEIKDALREEKKEKMAEQNPRLKDILISNKERFPSEQIAITLASKRNRCIIENYILFDGNIKYVAALCHVSVLQAEKVARSLAGLKAQATYYRKILKGEDTEDYLRWLFTVISMDKEASPTERVRAAEKLYEMQLTRGTLDKKIEVVLQDTGKEKAGDEKIKEEDKMIQGLKDRLKSRDKNED